MCLLTGSVVISIVLLALTPTGASAEQGGLEKRVAQLEAQVTALTAALQEAQEILQFVRVETEEIGLLAGPHWIIEGANVHVRSGSGDTQDGCGLLELDYPNCESLTGLGNLIVGYNERGRGVPDRSGSHNLVVGRSHIYGSFGGLVAGRFNTILGAFASGPLTFAKPSRSWSPRSSTRRGEGKRERARIPRLRPCAIKSIESTNMWHA